jgi:hypothetical protein
MRPLVDSMTTGIGVATIADEVRVDIRDGEVGVDIQGGPPGPDGEATPAAILIEL